MKYERSKNATRNIITGLFNKLILIVFPFIIRTFIIKKLGMEYSGLDNLFTSILQVLNLSELGFSSAVVYCMYKPLADNNVEEVNALYGFVKHAYTIVGFLVLGIGIILLPFLHLFISGDIPRDINIYMLYLIYLLNTVGSYFLFAYKNVLLYANQRIDITNRIYTFSRMVMYIVQLVLLLVFENYYLYIIILPLSTILNNLITLYIVDKNYSQYSAEGELSDVVKKDIKYQISGLFIGKVSQVTRNSFDSIILSSLFGLTITAIYNNYYYILSAIVAIMVVISSSIIPGIGNSIVSETKNKNYSDFLKFNFIYMWIAGCITVCLVCLYQPFMKLWVGEKNILSTTSAFLFAIYFFCLMIGNVRAVYIEAAGLWWQNKSRAIMESILNLLLNIILGKLLGINGILIATIVTIVVVNFFLSSKILYKHYFDEYKIKAYYLNTMLYAFVTFIASVICYRISWCFRWTGFLNLIMIGICCILVTNIIYLIFYRKTEAYKNAKVWIKIKWRS